MDIVDRMKASAEAWSKTSETEQLLSDGALEITRLRSENKKLHAALLRYSDHYPECAKELTITHDRPMACDCGLDSILEYFDDFAEKEEV